jgi:anthranilate synthase component I
MANMIDVTPVSIEMDLRDPDKAYATLQGPDTYLLESAEGGEKVARYSFIGFNPVAHITIKNKRVKFETEDPQLSGLRLGLGDPLSIMRNIMSQFRVVDSAAQEETRFFGGFVGYFSYDLVGHYVRLENSRDELNEPDCEFILCKNNLIFDHMAKKTVLTQNEFGKTDEEEVMKQLDAIARELEKKAEGVSFRKAKKTRLAIVSNIPEKRFHKMVRKAVKYIREGDIIQAVISQRFGCSFGGDSFTVFRNLKRINPSPYMYYLDLGERRIAGSSPEMLTRVEGGKVLTYPIAGTRPRGADDAEDMKLEQELLKDKKERAEHLMLVDLGRNDIGRIAKFGSVKVNKFMSVEKYSHVQHLVSEVEGELKDGLDCFDALKSIFPAGTVSGAPKVRAMEIISELEPSRRGIYAGCVGYLGFNGNMDTAIAIRTAVFEGDKAYVQAGAGIVADSKPEREFTETVNKARGILKALEEAGK